MDIQNKKQIILKKRGIAFAIDYFLIMVIHKSVMLSFDAFITNFLYHLPDKTIDKIFVSVQSSSLQVSLVVFWSYFVTSLYLGNGQTPGKVFLGLRVFGSDHAPSLKESFMRTLGYFCCFITLSILFIIPYFNRSKKGIPDWLSNTYVDYEDFTPVEETNNVLPFVQPELFPEDSDIRKSA